MRKIQPLVIGQIAWTWTAGSGAREHRDRRRVQQVLLGHSNGWLGDVRGRLAAVSSDFDGKVTRLSCP
ncbi:MAG: hypothetical protein KGL43_25145 [Burkholderiales bacterium]|nr:hypothetical protein [Burkholderiales bacterium]MDE2456890.1 hypothetical protein [Burkholderiales bacterium]